MKKALSVLLVAVLLLSLFSGCAAKTGSGSGKDKIVLGCETEPASIGPTGSTGEQTTRIRRLICEGMFDINEAGEFVPKLATSWEWEDDVTLVFHLREGVKFSDGVAFSADDVIFTLQNQIDTGTSSLLGQYMDKFEKRDDKTVVIHFKEVNSLCFDKFSSKWLPIIHKETYEADPNQMNYMIVGTGPYVLKSWTTGENMILERNDNYWGDKAKIKNVEFKFITENSQRTIAMETGTIDINCAVDAADLDYFKDESKYTVSYNPGVFLRELFFNLSRETPIADVRVRKAIAYAFDVEAMCKTYLQGTVEPLTSNISKNYASIYEDGSEVLYAYNLDKAKELMAEAGYPDGGFTLSLLCSGTRQDDTEQAEILQAALAPLGITVELVIRDAMTWYTTCIAKEEWDMCWFSLGDESPVFAWMHFVGDFDHFGMPDYTNYRNDAFTDAMLEASRTNDTARQKELFSIMNNCMTEDLPMYSLYNPVVISVYNAGIKGIEYRNGNFNVEEMYFG